MKNTKLEIDVVVIEEDDLADVNDEARVTGKMEDARLRLASFFDRSVTVQVGLKGHPRKGSEPWVSIGGVRLVAGEALAFLPTGPAKVDPPVEAPAPAKKAAKKAAAKE